ncbi:MAG: hypothetical protein KF859_05870 [Phycisphaeraceae bacterium]|nr:hypothetical protein [Phycisphaeraceae bacterium]
MNQERTTQAHRSFFERHHFLLRRLHSLSGVVPIGLFMIVHLTTNSSIVWGAINAEKGANALERTVATFQKEVYFIHSLPFLIFTEIFVLWLPIAFHSVLGVYYARTGRSNTSRYAYQDNWRYTLQRVSGYIGLLFIFYHVATLRWGWTFLVPGGTRWEYSYAASTLAASLRGSMNEMTLAGFAVSLFYFIGVTALVYHFANGLWTAAITWGLTVSARAQKRWGYVCAGLGLGLMLMGWSSVIGFAALSPEQAMRVENKVMPVDIRLKLEQEGKLKSMPGEARSAGVE